MADNYNDTYSGIERGKHIVAQDVVDALNTKEKVEHKISITEWPANKTSETKYPSCAAANDAINALAIIPVQLVSKTSTDTEIPSAQSVYSFMSAKMSEWQAIDKKVPSYLWSGNNTTDDSMYPTCGAVNKAINAAKPTPVAYISSASTDTQIPAAVAVWNLFKDLYYA
ncbi:MAG: hypothetical protein LBK68_02785 [Candidatus Margulisbacteria bacterium]|jgi:hypothetical protein|nr:hypothetical protein [Candidatus Margulisiibacteriota bacterium]